MYREFFKRFFDIVFSALALIVLSPLLLVLAILVRVKLGSPVIFCQERPGWHEKIFKLYKFRSMTDERDEDGKLLPDEVRLTPFGKKLRSTSLDELPELWNILKGDMSIVGPRPQLVRDMVFMTTEQRKRYLVRPGLTGLAQISGRNAIEWEKKLAFDLMYIDSIRFISDLKIVIKTIVCLFNNEDVSAERMATAEDYGDYLLRVGRVTEEEYRKHQEEARLLLSR